jgi:hypothetical protein
MLQQSAGTIKPPFSTRHSVATTGRSTVTYIAHDIRRGDRQAAGAFSYITLGSDAPDIVQAPAFPPVPG